MDAPIIVQDCVDYLYEKGKDARAAWLERCVIAVGLEEGIFRIPGKLKEIEQLKKLYNDGKSWWEKSLLPTNI